MTPITLLVDRTEVKSRTFSSWTFRVPCAGVVRLDVRVEAGDDVQVFFTTESGHANFRRESSLEHSECLPTLSRLRCRELASDAQLGEGVFGLILFNRTWGILSSGTSTVLVHVSLISSPHIREAGESARVPLLELREDGLYYDDDGNAYDSQQYDDDEEGASDDADDVDDFEVDDDDEYDGRHEP